MSAPPPGPSSWRRHQNAVRRIGRVLLRARFRPRLVGAERVPAAGGVIVASNHVSYLDPPVVGVFLPRNVRFLAKSELFRSRAFGGYIASLGAVPVRRAELDRAVLRAVRAILEGGDALLLFPEGTRSRDGRLGAARPGVAIFARESGAPVLPLHVQGTARWWRGAGRRPLTLTFGTPLAPPPPGARGEELAAYAARVMDAIASLAPPPPA